MDVRYPILNHYITQYKDQYNNKHKSIIAKHTTHMLRLVICCKATYQTEASMYMYF